MHPKLKIIQHLHQDFIFLFLHKFASMLVPSKTHFSLSKDKEKNNNIKVIFITFNNLNSQSFLQMYSIAN